MHRTSFISMMNTKQYAPLLSLTITTLQKTTPCEDGRSDGGGGVRGMYSRICLDSTTWFHLSCISKYVSRVSK